MQNPTVASDLSRTNAELTVRAMRHASPMVSPRVFAEGNEEDTYRVDVIGYMSTTGHHSIAMWAKGFTTALEIAATDMVAK